MPHHVSVAASRPFTHHSTSNQNSITQNNSQRDYATTGSDQVTRIDAPILSSAAIIGLAIAIVLVLLLLVDLLCCMLIRAGILAALCRRTKRSPSELDDEAKIGR